MQKENWTAYETTTFWRGEELGKMRAKYVKRLFGVFRCLRSPSYIKCKSVRFITTSARNFFLSVAFGQERIFARTSTTKSYNNRRLNTISFCQKFLFLQNAQILYWFSFLQRENSRAVYIECDRNITLLAMTFKDLVAPKRAVCLSG